MSDYTTNQNVGREYDWDDAIEKDSEYILLPEGDYSFEIINVERSLHNGSEKLPPCKKAVVTVRVYGDGAEVDLKYNLFLHSICEGMLCAFFTAIGQRQHGERITMNWNKVVGSKGRCKIGIRTWMNKNDEEMKSNDIKKFYEPEKVLTKQYKAGTF